MLLKDTKIKTANSTYNVFRLTLISACEYDVLKCTCCQLRIWKFAPMKVTHLSRSLFVVSLVSILSITYSSDYYLLAGLFSIDAQTGNITVAGSLPDGVSFYSLNLVAQDLGTPSESQMVSRSIVVVVVHPSTHSSSSSSPSLPHTIVAVVHPFHTQ
jgi:hypothetical protein